MRRGNEQESRYRRTQFDAFVAATGGRLLHAALLLTGDADEAAHRTRQALALTWLQWDHLHGDDPYTFAVQEMFSRWAGRGPLGAPARRVTERLLAHRPLAHLAHHGPDAHHGQDGQDGRREPAATALDPAAVTEIEQLDVLSRLERGVLVLRLFEGAGEAQVAAVMGLRLDSTREICARAAMKLRRRGHPGYFEHAGASR